MKTHLHTSSSSIGTATLVGFGLLNYRWVFSAGRFLQSASGTSIPQLGGLVIRTFQLPPPGVPTSETTRANPSSGRWNYGREISENFAESGDFNFRVLLHAVKYDMGPTALLPLRRKARWRFFRPKNPTASAGFEPANSGTLTSRPPKPLCECLMIFREGCKLRLLRKECRESYFGLRGWK